MLFSSTEFIFLFLPVCLLVYFFLAKRVAYFYAKAWLLAASLFFYAYWNPANVWIIILSCTANYAVGKKLLHSKNKSLLLITIALNILVLGYYKYTDFFIANLNLVAAQNFPLLHIILPIGISFFTFQQVAFLVDSYQGKVPDFSFSDYCLFVTFFPQLIAGPIVHHGEMMPQFANPQSRTLTWENFTKGLFIFNMGLAKKLVIADSLSVIVVNGYQHASALGIKEAWITSLFYSMQLYFDFSGYSDMAIGLGLLFNIHLPFNFNSPYKAINIQDFWRRWHITLSRFLRDYIYIPLGGSRTSETQTSRNLLLTFLIGGFWHGAGWTFIMWGALHGIALNIHRAFSKLNIKMPNAFAILITFLFVNITWVFFRANSWDTAIHILRAMVGLNEAQTGFTLINDYYNLPIWIAATVLLFGKNTNEIGAAFKPTLVYGLKFVFLILLNLLFLNSSISQEFLYFDF
ncbi:MAG: membrane bound O-acyl transferase MBOAT family protein [Bacteroidetes bacterium OLB12]|nr:MAG: membrane bound O-acyl transferase MBOAT family protein [Bacteroidetes bacterium OLB12]HNR73544.1 MBOAT family protein [Cyclobacteriaceae bacterium]HNU40960.1 MBOAT family protein [Cyclobacteriaceae bacterium]